MISLAIRQHQCCIHHPHDPGWVNIILYNWSQTFDPQGNPVLDSTVSNHQKATVLKQFHTKEKVADWF
jgi:hypothetical protein